MGPRWLTEGLGLDLKAQVGLTSAVTVTRQVQFFDAVRVARKQLQAIVAAHCAVGLTSQAEAVLEAGVDHQSLRQITTMSLLRWHFGKQHLNVADISTPHWCRA